jgi:hypothetical protein
LQEAQEHLGRDNGWQELSNTNREGLLDTGLWSVPSYRVSTIRGHTASSDNDDGEEAFCTWGQDRIWLVEQEIQKPLKLISDGNE